MFNHLGMMKADDTYDVGTGFILGQSIQLLEGTHIPTSLDRDILLGRAHVRLGLHHWKDPEGINHKSVDELEKALEVWEDN